MVKHLHVSKNLILTQRNKMKNISLLLTSTLLLLSFQGCGNDSKEQDAKVVVSGIEKENMDLSVRSQDDFFHHVNGLWIQKAEIPADKTSLSNFSELQDKIDISLNQIIQDAAKDKEASATSKKRLLGDFYTSYMDTSLANTKGYSPLNATLEVITNATTHEDITEIFATAQAMAIKIPIAYTIMNDQKNSKQYITYISQSGVNLPDKIYYSSEDVNYVSIREKYKTYIASLMRLSGYENADTIATNILALETKLSEIQWTQQESASTDKTYNKYTKNDAKTLFGAFDFEAYLNKSNLNISEMIISQPSYFKEFAKLFKETPVSVWREYLAYNYINGHASYLSDNFVTLEFDFFEKTIKGVQEQTSRQKNGVELTSALLGEIIGELYVEKEFSQKGKTKALEMTQNILETFRTSIAELEWMSETTKQEALKKLNKITIKIAYPDTWKDYSALDIKKDDLVGNMQRYIQWNDAKEKKKLGTPVDNSAWFMTPQTINAYYSPLANEIVFPAAILQAPFFDINVDDAVNYGAIGTVIGHELTHAFDTSGSKYDGDGNLNNWWQESDREAFEELGKKLVEQYNQYKPFEGEETSVNGQLTLNENIADLGGVNMAYKAYINSLKGKNSPIIDGYTGEQRFFIGHAQVWKGKYRQEYLKDDLLTNVHSPGIYRTNGVMTNFSDFYKAFDVTPSDKLYKPEQERIKIW